MITLSEGLLGGVLGIQLMRLFQSHVSRLQRAEAFPVPQNAVPLSYPALDFELVGADGAVRSWVQTSKYKEAPPTFDYGGVAYVRAPKQPENRNVIVYVEK